MSGVASGASRASGFGSAPGSCPLIRADQLSALTRSFCRRRASATPSTRETTRKVPSCGARDSSHQTPGYELTSRNGSARHPPRFPFDHQENGEVGRVNSDAVGTEFAVGQHHSDEEQRGGAPDPHEPPHGRREPPGPPPSTRRAARRSRRNQRRKRATQSRAPFPTASSPGLRNHSRDRSRGVLLRSASRSEMPTTRRPPSAGPPHPSRPARRSRIL